MQLLIDHLAAVIIGASVILIIAALHLRGQDAAVNAVQFNMAKKDMSVFTEMVEQDFANIGAGLINTSYAISGGSTDTTNGFISFYTIQWTRDTTANETADSVLVRYEWKKDGKMPIEVGKEIDAYRVRRLVNGALTYEDKVGRFRLRALDGSMMPRSFATSSPTDRAAIRRLDIEAMLAYERIEGKKGAVNVTRWHREFMPLNLNRAAPQVLPL